MTDNPEGAFIPGGFDEFMQKINEIRGQFAKFEQAQGDDTPDYHDLADDIADMLFDSCEMTKSDALDLAAPYAEKMWLHSQAIDENLDALSDLYTVCSFMVESYTADMASGEFLTFLEFQHSPSVFDISDSNAFINRDSEPPELKVVFRSASWIAGWPVSTILKHTPGILSVEPLGKDNYGRNANGIPLVAWMLRIDPLHRDVYRTNIARALRWFLDAPEFDAYGGKENRKLPTPLPRALELMETIRTHALSVKQLQLDLNSEALREAAKNLQIDIAWNTSAVAINPMAPLTIPDEPNSEDIEDEIENGKL